MKFNRKDLSDTELLQLYRGILKPRMIEEKMLAKVEAKQKDRVGSNLKI